MKMNKNFIISRIIVTIILIIIFILQNKQIIPDYTFLVFIIVFFILDKFMKRYY